MASRNLLSMIPKHLLYHIVTEHLSIADIACLSQTSRDLNHSFCGSTESTQRLWKTLYQRDISKLRLPTDGDYRTAYQRIMESIQDEIEVAEDDWNVTMDPSLAYVAERGYELLVDRYLRILSFDPYQTRLALWAVSQHGYIDLVQSLIVYDITLSDSALQYASSRGHKDIVDYLLTHGATDLDGALQWASMGGNQDMVCYLLTKGATNFSGALWYASYSGHRSLVEHLLSYPQINQAMIDRAIDGVTMVSRNDIVNLLKSHVIRS